MTFQKPKGTEDFLPKELAERDTVFRLLRETSKRFGYQEVDIPVVETVPLLTAKSGQEVLDQLFVLQKKGSEELALRFDLTVPMTRLFIEEQKKRPKPLKWYSIQKNWRYEAPQRGRQREFFQWSVELFGSPNPEADADVINLALQGLFTLGLSPADFVIKLNNRKLLEGLLFNIIGQASFEAVTRIIDKRDKISEQDFIKELNTVGLDKTGIDGVLRFANLRGPPEDVFPLLEEFTLSEKARQGRDELKALCTLLDKPVILDLSIARGLAYYTGTVFEIFDTKGKFRAIAGGGRYDQLVELLGGETCPAVGFAMGYSTLRLLLEEREKLPNITLGPDYFIIPVTQNELPKALELATELRTQYSVDIDLMRRKISKQFDYANAINAKNVIVIGEEEIKKGIYRVKNMKTGEERELTREQLLETNNS